MTADQSAALGQPLCPTPVGIYVHFPFCLRKCTYCDFYSLPFQADLAERYCLALLSEINRIREEQDWGSVGSIYLGGGTPSLIKPRAVESLLGLIRKSFAVTPDCEITMEANPGTLSLESLKAYHQAGVNRVSLGVQSFDESHLSLLGRIHSPDDVKRSVENLLKLGIINYGFDLIYGIPGQSLNAWLLDLQKVADLSPRHLSCYLLQMDEGVPLAARIRSGEIAGLPEEEEAEMYYSTIRRLKSGGYQHYEISNFCQPGWGSRHNINYWEAGEYLGLGAGAVSFKGGKRYRNLPQLHQYIQNLSTGDQPPCEVLESLTEMELGIDGMIMGLRMTQGINVREFRQRFGIDPVKTFQQAITRSQEEGLLELEPPWLKLTPKGYFLSNRVLVRILEYSV